MSLPDQHFARSRQRVAACGSAVVAAARAWDADGSPEAAAELKRAVRELRAAEAEMARGGGDAMSKFGNRANDPQLDLVVRGPDRKPSRSTSSMWRCEKCGASWAIFDPGPTKATHAGPAACSGSAVPCGGTLVAVPPVAKEPKQ